MSQCSGAWAMPLSVIAFQNGAGAISKIMNWVPIVLCLIVLRLWEGGGVFAIVVAKVFALLRGHLGRG